MQRIKFFIITGLFFFSFTVARSQSPAYNIKVYANGYSGKLAISGSGNYFFLNSDTTLSMYANSEGNYYLNTGANISITNGNRTSDITLYFNQSGEIDSIHPKGSASIGKDKKSISLETAMMIVDPGNFNREWYPSFGVNLSANTNYYYGKQKLKLIKEITYYINFAPDAGMSSDCNTNPLYYVSGFNFTLLTNGKIDLFDRNKVSATSSGNTMKFNTIMVSLSPQDISGGIPLLINKPGTAPIKITNKTSLPFIKGKVTYVHWFNAAGEMIYFHFLPM